jgi:hypothetical protein
MCQEEWQKERKEDQQNDLSGDWRERYQQEIKEEKNARLCAVRNFLSVAAVCLGLLIATVLVARWIKDVAFQSVTSPEGMAKTAVKYYKNLPDNAQDAYEAITKLNSAVEVGAKYDQFAEAYTDAYSKFMLFKKSRERKYLEAFEHHMDLAIKQFGDAKENWDKYRSDNRPTATYHLLHAYDALALASHHVESVDFLLDPEKQEFYLREFYNEKYFKGKEDKVKDAKADKANAEKANAEKAKAENR